MRISVLLLLALGTIGMAAPDGPRPTIQTIRFVFRSTRAWSITTSSVATHRWLSVRRRRRADRPSAWSIHISPNRLPSPVRAVSGRTILRLSSIEDFNRRPAAGQLTLPDGQITKTCPARQQKIFRFPRRANQRYQLAPSRLTGGAYAQSSRNARRDAMDAAARETSAPMRTAKSCGPDAPTLASSS